MTLKKFREAFVLSRAKDDVKDALCLARLLLTHYTELTPWQPEPPATRLLQQLVAHRRAVVDERTGLSNRLIALLNGNEYAKESILFSRWAAADYWQQREKGCGHHTAVRALAFKWQRVLWRCWQDHQIYQEHIYEAALRRSGSLVVSRLNKIELGKSPVKKTTK